MHSQIEGFWKIDILLTLQARCIGHVDIIAC